MQPITLTFPLPDPKLNPNRRTHWAPHSILVKKRKHAVTFNTIRQIREAGLPGNLKWKHVLCAIKWYYDDQRPDYDNAIGWLKSTFDGIEKAGVILNDKYLKPLPPEFIQDKEPRVELTLTLMEGV